MSLKEKNIIKRLNYLFANYQQLSVFCENLDNDIEQVIAQISKVIKFAFTSDRVMNLTLSGITYNLKDVDENYQNYLAHKKHFSFFKKKLTPSDFPLPLDRELNLSLLYGLKLPSRSRLEEICQANLLAKKSNRHLSPPEELISPNAYEYSSYEIIPIDSHFCYYYHQATGDIFQDFTTLYQRYANSPNNPLNNDYYQNIASIQASYNIILRRLGSSYEIISGRHRILYILYNLNREASVPLIVEVKKGFEDAELNNLLNDLISNYKVSIYKNNILNNEPNILIELNNVLYEIKDKSSLITFLNNLNNNLSNETIPSIPLISTSSQHIATVNEYKKMVYDKLTELGPTFITSNFTDIIKYFPNQDTILLYTAYNLVQSEYQRTLLTSNLLPLLPPNPQNGQVRH